MISEEENNFQNFRAAVIGVGNDFRGDDAVGLLCARKLKKCINKDEAEVIELAGDLSQLLEIFPKWDAVIIIDAIQSEAKPGTIFRISVKETLNTGEYFNFSSHTMDLLKLIQLFKIINKSEKPVIVYGVSGKNFSFSTLISPDVYAAIELICERIKNELRSLANV